jgi:dipeptidyl aminopeptidase/acylaminoacyl peptidase
MFLPDGKHFLFRRQGPPEGIYIGSIEQKPDQQELNLLPEMSDPNAAFFYVPDSGSRVGNLLFSRDGILLAQGFDADRLQLVGDAVPILDEVSAGDSAPSLFSVSNNGVLVSARAAGARKLIWLNRDGIVVSQTGIAASVVELSPDSSKVAFLRGIPGHKDTAIWIADVKTGAENQLTLSPGAEQFPVWSHDGYRVAFTHYGAAGYSVYQKNASGAGNEEPLVLAKLTIPTDWAEDGRLLYMSRNPETKADLWVLPPGGGKAFPILAGSSNEHYGKFSPDGRWIAYVSDVTGKDEIYVASAERGAGANGPGNRVSINGGVRVRWRRDGRELFYFSSDGTIMAVTVNPGPTFEAAHSLFRTVTEPSGWDVTPDGQRFLVSQPAETQAQPLVVTLNWTSLLKH